MKRLLPTLLLALSLASCGSPAEDTGTAETPSTVSDTPTTSPVPVEVSTTTPAVPTSTPPAPTTASTEGLRLGEWANFPDGFNTRALQFRSSVAAAVASEASGGRWASVLVESCNDKRAPEATISWQPWTLVDSSNGQYPSSSVTYQAFPVPEYPFSDGTLKPGACKRGWIVFDVSREANITSVTYVNEAGYSASWKA